MPIVEPVGVDDESPSTGYLGSVASRLGFEKRPTQICNVLDSSAWAGLLPVDQTDRLAVADNDVSRLKVVMDDALCVIDKSGGEVMQRAHDPSETDDIDVLAGRSCRARYPRHDFQTSLVVDPESSWRPIRFRIFQESQHRLHKSRVRADWSLHGVAHAQGTVHPPTVMQPEVQNSRSASPAPARPVRSKAWKPRVPNAVHHRLGRAVRLVQLTFAKNEGDGHGTAS